MQCKHLSCYSHGSNRWAVASCTAKPSPYVPSVFELEHFCQNAKHGLCPTFLIALGAEKLGSSRPVLAMAVAG